MLGRALMKPEHALRGPRSMHRLVTCMRGIRVPTIVSTIALHQRTGSRLIQHRSGAVEYSVYFFSLAR